MYKKIAGKLLTLLSGRYIVFYNIILGRLDVVYRPKVVSSTIIISEQIRCYFSKFFRVTVEVGAAFTDDRKN